MNPAILRLLGPVAIVLMLAGLGFYLHHSGVQAGKREVQALWDAEKVQAQQALIEHNAKTALKDEQARTNQTEAVHVYTSQTVTIPLAVDAAASAAASRLRELANRTRRDCPVPQGASAASGGDGGQTTVAAQLRDADREDLVAVSAAADKEVKEQRALIDVLRKLLREAWRQTN